MQERQSATIRALGFCDYVLKFAVIFKPDSDLDSNPGPRLNMMLKLDLIFRLISKPELRQALPYCPLREHRVVDAARSLSTITAVNSTAFIRAGVFVA